MSPPRPCAKRRQPAGLYFGYVSDAIFDAVLPRITLPTDAEGFTVVRHPVSEQR
jgi:hypothetical protein